MRTGRFWLGLMLLPGCGAAEAVPAAHPPAGTEARPDPVASQVRPAADSSSPVAAPRTDATVKFEPAPASPPASPVPHVEIKFPIAEQRIVVPKAARYRVRLKVEGWPLGKNGAAVQLALDDHPPRLLESLRSPVRLGELVAEDQELEPGAHRLFAVAVHGTGEMMKPTGPISRGPFATVHFHVGARGEPSPDVPMLVYSQPRGTFNGEAAADSVLVDFFVLNATLGNGTYGVEIAVKGRDKTWSTRLRSWQPLLVRGLPSGDYEVVLQLLDRNDQPVTSPGARVRRTITVNRDAPVPTEGGS